MKEITLTKGYKAIVDDEDFDRINQFKWHWTRGYARRQVTIAGHRWYIWMHRAINNTPPDQQTDHINGNKLDNRQSNLRSCSKMENQWNKIGWSKIGKGIQLRPKGNYQATIWNNGKSEHIGVFDTLEEAKAAYNQRARELRGQFHPR